MTQDRRFRGYEFGYDVDVAHLLFTPDRDFLLTRDGEKVKAADLKGKTIVLIICPLYDPDDFKQPWDNCPSPGCMRDMVDAYNELKLLTGVEFVFVPVYLRDMSHYVSPNHPHSQSKEAIYDDLLSTMPWPAIPFDDVLVPGGRVAETFAIDRPFRTPFWVIIDGASKVVATRSMFPYLFKLFGGAELYPLSRKSICALWDDFDPWSDHYLRLESRERVIDKWDQHLASPGRDFVLSTNGDKVPIPSLYDKVIGLYFCENIPHPPNMELIKKVYDEAKERGYAFEIVQINFHYQFFNAKYTESADLDKEVAYENIKWLRLPFKDPSCRKLQRMFQCKLDEEYNDWHGDCLVIIDPRKADDCTEVLFEFCGAAIFEEYEIEGYPFTRPSLFDIECKRQEELTLQSLFGQRCRFIKNGCDWGDVSRLEGKRVLVLFGGCQLQHKYFLDESKSETLDGELECECYKFVYMLKSKYGEQLDDEAGEKEFEVVYCPIDSDGASLSEYTKDMAWLLFPTHDDFVLGWIDMIFKYYIRGIGAAAFERDGRLIAKEKCLCFGWGKSEPDEFPFVSQDWNRWIEEEVGALCDEDTYHPEHSYHRNDMTAKITNEFGHSSFVV